MKAKSLKAKKKSVGINPQGKIGQVSLWPLVDTSKT
jgi:hypothetical protein